MVADNSQTFDACMSFRNHLAENASSHTVFIKQESSASQMTAAKIMDIISRLPGCDGQAADAVSADTQVKKGICPKIIEKFQNRNVQTFGFVYHDTWPKSRSSMEYPVVPLERNLYGHPLEGLLWERQFEKILLKYGWDKVSNLECLLVHREKSYSSLCMWMT